LAVATYLLIIARPYILISMYTTFVPVVVQLDVLKKLTSAIAAYAFYAANLNYFLIF